ncbi:uncharacterized protein LOC123412485 [Hordeum vulgare subsp. vulgare]|uniref:Predicted protein n=1 Tax=Hordeum vulgare subsp. vulgare TaxID=112509 RepID=F2DEZ5_HORVV|nr:uncharacterized protein LOC123412485 [Hordeum vulgare subsp. vulgare]BAJ93666.1 predicted protein [Hordeum vulgare subsp. vulgare]
MDDNAVGEKRVLETDDQRSPGEPPRRNWGARRSVPNRRPMRPPRRWVVASRSWMTEKGTRPRGLCRRRRVAAMRLWRSDKGTPVAMRWYLMWPGMRRPWIHQQAMINRMLGMEQRRGTGRHPQQNPMRMLICLWR